jgi:hypothetical protein
MAREPPADSDAESADSATDASGDPPTDSESGPTGRDRGSVGDATVTFDGDGRREVELPLRLYKTVTVFSTLIAVVCVVVGFLLFDAATLGGSLFRRLVTGAFAAVGLSLAEGTLSALFAVAGLLAIGGGAAVYILGTRFRAPGMTGERDDAEE